MAPERLNILHTAFHTAKLKGLRNNITPAPISFASELLGLLTRKINIERKHHGKNIKDSYSRALPTHVYTALQKWALVTQEKWPLLDFNASYPHYWSADSRDALFDAHLDSLSSQFTGFSLCHPIYNDHTIYLGLRHAIYSATLSTEATATFMFLPSWSGSMITNPYSSLLDAYLHLCYKLGKFQLLRLPTLPLNPGLVKRLPYPRPLGISISRVWNTAALLHLSNHNTTGDIPEANWHLNNIASHPIRNARHAETAPGLKNFEKLHSDKMQTTRCSHRPALVEVAPLSHHFKPGLTCRLEILGLHRW